MKLDPPDLVTCQQFKLVFADDRPMEPIIVSDAVVWASAAKDEDPYYAIFEAGTNSLVILEKRPGKPWDRVELEEVENLYGLIWKLCAEFKLVRHNLRKITRK